MGRLWASSKMTPVGSFIGHIIRHAFINFLVDSTIVNLMDLWKQDISKKRADTNQERSRPPEAAPDFW